MDTISELEKQIQEGRDAIAEADANLVPALDGAVRVINDQWWVPYHAKKYVADKANSCMSRYPECRDPAVEATEIILRQIADSKAVTATAPQYCDIDFSAVSQAIGPDSLGPRAEDWTSDNTTNYRNAVYSMPTKLQNLIDAVEEICEIFTELDEDYQSYFTGLLVAVISAVVALVGLALAIVGVATAWAAGSGIVLAVASLFVAIVGAVVSAVSFATLTDIEGSISDSESKLKDVATSVRAAVWPAQPALGAGW